MSFSALYSFIFPSFFQTIEVKGIAKNKILDENIGKLNRYPVYHNMGYISYLNKYDDRYAVETKISRYSVYFWIIFVLMAASFGGAIGIIYWLFFAVGLGFIPILNGLGARLAHTRSVYYVSQLIKE